MYEMFFKLEPDKQNRIIEAGLEEFSKSGYINASTNHIVKAISISKGSLFKYFNSKKEFYLFLVNYANEKLITYLDENFHVGLTWQENILAYAGLEFDFHMKYPLIFSFYKKMMEDFQLEIFKADQEDLLSYSQDLFKKLMGGFQLNEVEIRHIGFVVKGYNEWFYETYMKDCSQVDEMKETYLKGLKTHLSMIGGKDGK